ncbi:MAG: PEGA domain-containing protein [Candidatus Parcubacteria bacterium]
MSAKSRHLMFVIALILFIVLTTGLSIFASGYRFNWKAAGGWQNLLVKTGSLLVESEPKGALASLEQIHGHHSPLENKTTEERKTPLKLNNILPGEYLLTLELQGYLPYQKKISITPSMTTILSEVVLFKNCLPMLVLPTESNNFNYRPGGRYLALPEEEMVFDLSAEKTLIKISRDSQINWANGNQAADGARVINLDQGVVSDYTARLGKVDSGLMSGNFLIYSQAGRLSSLEVNTKKVRALKTQGMVSGYEVLGDTLVALSTQEADTRLEFIDYKNNTLLKETALLKAEKWNLTKSEDFLILSDQDHKITYLVDTKAQEVKHLLRDSTQAVFLKKEDLVYVRGSEIHLYHLGSQKDFLLTRLGSEITSLSVGPTSYLVYATNQEVGILNLDDPKKETTILFSGANISQLSFEKSDNSIFFYAEIGAHKGLYKIDL